jgi:hypothetical protein
MTYYKRMKEYKNKCGLSKLYTIYENESNIKYYKNKLELTIINILYKNINVDFTKNKLFYELQKRVTRLPYIILNEKDIFIIFCFIWHQLIFQNNTFIIYDNNTIKLNMNYYLNNTLEFDKLLENNNVIEQLSYNTTFINEYLYEIDSYEDTHSKIYISYFIKHLLYYKEIYIKSQFIKEFITIMITENIEYITNTHKIINKINNIISNDTCTNEICDFITLDDIIDKLIAKINY